MLSVSLFYLLKLDYTLALKGLSSIRKQARGVCMSRALFQTIPFESLKRTPQISISPFRTNNQ